MRDLAALRAVLRSGTAFGRGSLEPSVSDNRDAFFDEMIRDPETQGLRQGMNGIEFFSDKEFAVLLKAIFPQIAMIENEAEAYEQINACFRVFKLYRLHESILATVLRGHYKVMGIDENNEPILEPLPAAAAGTESEAV